MRPHRSHHLIWPAILTAAVGIGVTPATTHAGVEPIAPADDTAGEPEPAATEPSSPPPTEAPEPEPDTDAPPAQDETDPEDTAPPQTDPEPVRPAPDDTTGERPRPGTPRPESPAADVEDSDEDPAIRDEPTPGEDELEHDAFEALPDGLVRPISFPVLGAVDYGNGWGACRDGCSRRHVGTDMIGVRMQPLLAAVDGTVTRIRYENVGTAGSVITVTGADGWRYNYFHLNNDTPGTDDGLAGPEWQISPTIALGSTVRAGQVIAYMGDSGNAEGSVPHLHFEIRQPDGTPINPYHSLVAAQERQTCAPGEAQISLATDAAALAADVIAVIPIDGGGRWLIGRDGRLFADGPAARVPTVAGVDCATIAPPPAPLLPSGFTADAIVAPAVSLAAPAVAASPTTTPWTVQTGESLWRIAQGFYGVNDSDETASLVDLVVATNPIPDRDVLEVGMTLQLPALRF